MIDMALKITVEGTIGKDCPMASASGIEKLAEQYGILIDKKGKCVYFQQKKRRMM